MTFVAKEKATEVAQDTRMTSVLDIELSARPIEYFYRIIDLTV